jgi:hypothetical protein
LSTDALVTTTRSVPKRLDLTQPVAIDAPQPCTDVRVNGERGAADVLID